MPARYLYVFAVAVLGFLLAAAFIEYNLRHHFVQSSYYAKGLLMARAGKVDCVIVGDSHGAASFRDEVSGCQNLAAGGMGFVQIQDVLHSVLQVNQPKLVLMTFGPQLFSPERVHNTSRIFSSIAQDWTPLPNPLVVQPLLFDRWLQQHIQRLRGRSQGNNGFNEKHWGTVPKAKQQQNMLLRLSKQQPAEHFHQSKTMHAVSGFIQLLRSRGIAVCIVRTPVVDAYDALLSGVLMRPQWQYVIEQLQQSGATVVDYRQLKATWPDQLFANEDHLNPRGAQIFAPLAFDLCQSATQYNALR